LTRSLRYFRCSGFDLGKSRVRSKIRIGGKRHPTGNIDAYELYMKGRYNVAKGTPADLIASIPFFEDAIKIDPGYALAYTAFRMPTACSDLPVIRRSGRCFKARGNGTKGARH
jgi:hypothetical protein